jgi:hypothetical protein
MPQGVLKQYVNGQWVEIPRVAAHGALTGLNNDDHNQYLLINGTRAMTGTLDMAENAIDNVGSIDIANSAFIVSSTGRVDSSKSYTTDGTVAEDRLYDISATISSDNATANRFPRAIIATLTTAGSTNFGGNSQVYGLQGQVDLDADIAVNEAIGLHGRTFIGNNNTSLTTRAEGMRGELQAQIGTTGSVTDGVALSGLLNIREDIIITNASVVDANFNTDSGDVLTSTNAYYFRGINNITQAPTITNLYGLYLPSITEGTNNWGVYVDGTQNNYLGSGFNGIGTNTPAYKLDLEDTYTSDPSGTNNIGAYFKSLTNPTTPTNLTKNFIGFRADYLHTGSGDGSGTGEGFISNAFNQGAGDLTRIRGGRHTIGLTSTGNITTAEGLKIGAPFISGAGTITNNYGIRVGDQSHANITNTWGIYIEGSQNNYFGGSLKIGGTAVRATTAGTNRLDIFNGTAPVGTLANGISLYSTAGELRVMDAAGNATLLSPHDKETNEWIYDSVDKNGKRLRIDMERMMKAINDKFGWDFVKEFKVD